MRRPALAFVILLLVSVNFAPLFAQNQPKPVPPSQQPAATPAHDAKPSDVASPDAILAAYDVISGPAGQERNRDRMRSLFYPGAQLIRTAVKVDYDHLLGGRSASTSAAARVALTLTLICRHQQKQNTSCRSRRFSRHQFDV